MEKLGFKKAKPNTFGAPSYDPRDLLKVFLYSYPKGIRSSRKIATEIKRNLELIWLINAITPDFRTISDFRKDNINSIKKILKEFNKLCLELNVFSRELSSLDGSKFKAVNSKDNNFTKDKLNDRIERLNKKVEEYMKELDENDNNTLNTEQKINITDKLNKAKQKAIEYSSLMEELADSKETQISLTDKESRLMKCNGNMLVGFNTQMVVDTKSHIITNIETSNKPNDNGNMYNLASKTKEIFEVDQIEQLADGGYVDKDDIKKCLENKIVPILPDGEYIVTWDYKQNNIDEETKKGKTCEDVKKCLESGIIPDCYSHLEIKTEIKEEMLTINENAIISIDDENYLINKANEGFFVRNKNSNIVYCPNGNVLTYKRDKSGNDLFIGNSKCLSCPKKCTKKNVKELEISKYVDIASCKIYGTTVPKKNKVINKKVVVLTYIPDKDKYSLRKNTSEHPFGTIKRSHGASYLLLKGINKTEGELTLSVLGYNINRLIKIIGVKELIEYLNNKNNPNFPSISSILIKIIKKSAKSAPLFFIQSL